MPAPVRKNTYREWYKAVTEAGHAPPGPPPKIRGLGDLLERVFAPLAKRLKLTNCPACQKRKRWLNRLFPAK